MNSNKLQQLHEVALVAVEVCNSVEFTVSSNGMRFDFPSGTEAEEFYYMVCSDEYVASMHSSNNVQVFVEFNN